MSILVHYQSPYSNQVVSAQFPYSHSAKSTLLLSGFLPVEELDNTWKNPITQVVAHLEMVK